MMENLPEVPNGVAHNAVLPALTADQYDSIYWHLVRSVGGRNKDYLTMLYICAKGQFGINEIT